MVLQLLAAWWEVYESVLQGILARLRAGARWGKIADTFVVLRQLAARAACLDDGSPIFEKDNEGRQDSHNTTHT